ncbi:MAG TPA: DUF4129 domain-containing protein [Gaiellaceae bacterium]|nr:DUF4129 domain-containing protein [Gaiellaceae bacterium]
MRGRAAAVALPALVVLALVAFVAVAATGSVPRGSSDSRAPSDALLDTLFTLWIVAVVAGGILLVYGLTQRKAIAKQMASSRYPRFSVVSFLVFASVLALIVWLFKIWRPEETANVEEEGVFGGSTLPTTPGDTESIAQYEPAISWLAVVLVVALVAVAVLAYVVSDRRSRRARDSRAELARELVVALDDALDDLRAEANPRRAVIAAYARLERVLAARGVARRPAETSDEYLERVLDDLQLGSDAIERLTALFTRAKFSHHNVDTTMKEEAIGALEQVRDELRDLENGTTTPDRASSALEAPA